MSSCICCGSIVLPPPVSRWSAVPCSHLNYHPPPCLANSTTSSSCCCCPPPSSSTSSSWSNNPLLPTRSFVTFPSGLTISPTSVSTTTIGSSFINSFSTSHVPPTLPSLALTSITPSQTGQHCYPTKVEPFSTINAHSSGGENSFDASSRKRLGSSGNFAANSGSNLRSEKNELECRFLPSWSSFEEEYSDDSNKRRRLSNSWCSSAALDENLWSFPPLPAPLPAPSSTSTIENTGTYLPPPIRPGSGVLEVYPSLLTLPVLEPFYHANGGYVPFDKKLFPLPSCVDLYPPTPPKESGIFFKGRVNFPVQENSSNSALQTVQCKEAVLTKILKNLLKSQPRFFINPAELQTKQDSLMWNLGHMRKQLVLWIYQLNCAFNYHSETAYIAVYFVDKYLSRVKVTRSIQFYIVSTTAFYLAAKTHEEDREPRIQDVADCSRALGKEIFRKEIQRMERKMMSTLEYDLLVVTPFAAIAEIMKSVFWFNPTFSAPPLLSTTISTAAINPSPLSRTSNSERINLVTNCAYNIIELTTKYLNSMEYSPALLAAVTLGICMDITDGGKKSPRLGIKLLLRPDKPWWRDAASLAGGVTLEKVETCWQWVKELVSSSDQELSLLRPVIRVHA